MKIFNKISIITLILIASFLSIYRINVVDKKEISWDVLGYYLYLPATFIQQDPMLDDITWLKDLNSEKQLAGTLYMVSQNQQGEPMYFFLMGMAIFFLPFFFLGCIIAFLTGMPIDGFSPPFQYSLVVGGIIYTIIGLIFLRKILIRFFSEKLSSLIMIIIVFGTNYINHLTIKNLETVNVLFMLVTIVLWNTIKWHESFKLKNLIVIGSAITLITLIKPSEIVIIIIPLLWNVTSLDSFIQKLALLVKNKKSIFITIGICFLIVLPQLIYWYLKTGNIVYDSYINAGVGLDVFSPHILNILFSYRKGWLLYTPVMTFSLIGFYFLYKNNKQIFFVSLIYFLVSFYIIASWSEWWYGAAYSARPLIALYPILAICLGYFLNYINKHNLIVKISTGILIAFFIFLNQFQWWQYKNYILDPYRTTKEYYWATFLKTNIKDSDKDLLMVYRDFNGKMELTEKEKYQKSSLFLETFENKTNEGILTENKNHFIRLKDSQEYYPIVETRYNQITDKDHCWIKISMDIRIPNDSVGKQMPNIVLTMDRSNGSYGYFAPQVKKDSLANHWRNVEFMYLTPEIRNGDDKLKCYIWNAGKMVFDIDNLKVEIFTRKDK